MSKKIKKTAEAKGFSRIEAFADALRSKRLGSIDTLIIEANKRYKAKGGKDNVKEARTVTTMGMKILEALKIVDILGDVPFEERSYTLKFKLP